jgi:hypothetical protein
MRWIFRILVLLIVGAPLAVVGLVFGALEDQPTVSRNVEITPEQTERAKQLLKAHDPRRMPAGVVRTFSVSAEDLDLGLNFLVSQRGGASKTALSSGGAMFWLTLPVPNNPFGNYVNVEAVVRQTAGWPEFDRLRIGRVAVPGFAANWLLQRTLVRLEESAEVGVQATDVLKSIRMEPALVQVEYQWRDDLPERLRSALVSADDIARIRAYQERLAAITADPALPKQISITRLVQPLLAEASNRAAQGDPVAENRAALLVLAFYVNGRGLAALVPEARNWQRPTARKVTLAERGDFAQHFSVSAALAAVAGTPLSNAVGLYKEIDDSRGGSGFSFADLAADRAGTHFGERAVASARSALQMQERVTIGLVEADFMPPARDLPEGLSEAEFKRRYGSVDSPRYREVAERIEQRLGALALYR